MAQLFADRYLNFPSQQSSSPRKALAWPFYVWTILYPKPFKKSLNLFQQAILGMAQAQTTDPEEIGSLLGLAPDLVRWIIATELQPGCLLDNHGRLTRKGESVLNGYEEAHDQRIAGYAFQDAISGELMPRFFSGRLPEIEPINPLAERPEFLLNRGKGNTLRPFCVPVPQSHVAAPKIDDFFEAYRKYRREYLYVKNNCADTDEGIDNTLLESLKLMGTTPQPVYVVCWLFKAKDSERSWLMTDPLGLRGPFFWMRERVLKFAPNFQPLARMVTDLIGEKQDGVAVSSESLALIDEQAQWEILAEFPWASKIPKLERYLPSVIRQRKLVQSASFIGDELLDSLLSEAQKLGEGTLEWMLNKWPGPSDERMPSLNSQWRERLHQYKALGLPIVTESVAKTLANQHPKQVRNARDRQNESLKALLAAALLSCSEYLDHPLRSPNMSGSSIEGLLTLADVRNKAQHASGRRFEAPEVLKHADFILDWVKTFKEMY